ncbi:MULTISPECIES: hypothetical protein [Ralstonia solanacearum species complex]|uniref:hypothetical protein n=1 Tax=Ralstonia solanacearum species complex TaxID=3116862 RepID=UPI0013C31E3B|nr:hypothetical protein [Ralstonia solanacearum]
MQCLDGDSKRIGSPARAGRLRYLVRTPHEVLQGANFPQQPPDDRVVAAAFANRSQLGVR